jgi:3-oxoacyl-[acyl-carrier-protein] synthase II
MALWAAAEAVADAGGVVAGDALGVSVGTTLGAIGGFLDALRAEGLQPSRGAPPPWTWSAPAEAIAAAHGARGPVRVESVACSSGNAALGAALADLRAGRVQQVSAVGVDTLSDFVLAGFGVLKAVDPQPCRPFDRRRAGLNLGEAAAFLVIEDEAHARARGARIRALLAGYGDAADAHHMTGPDPKGLGAARAMKAALADAGRGPDDVDCVSAHGTSTVFNDLMEHHALHAVLGARAARVPLNSIKGAIGHTLGAAGAVEALLCVRQIEGRSARRELPAGGSSHVPKRRSQTPSIAP